VLAHLPRRAARRLLFEFTHRVSTLRMRSNRTEGDPSIELFLERCRGLTAPRVLELGTRRSIADQCTMHRDWVPHAREYLGCDIAGGIDVDLVADVHRLADVVGEERFDVIISCSSFEHFKYPHLAAHQIMRTLKVSGLLFIQTHQSFPLHAYPYDYFRFSREALRGLFGTKMGFDVIATNYDFPARIFTGRIKGCHAAPAFLNSCLFGEKTGTTPAEYVYELDG